MNRTIDTTVIPAEEIQDWLGQNNKCDTMLIYNFDTDEYWVLRWPAKSVYGAVIAMNCEAKVGITFSFLPLHFRVYLWKAIIVIGKRPLGGY
jgi:hypothetical protein